MFPGKTGRGTRTIIYGSFCQPDNGGGRSGAEGDVSVTTPLGTAVLGSVSFVSPVITAFTPTSGAAGAITITGANFSAVPASNHVYFGAVQAVVTTASTTSLTVEVPVGAAAYQPISVSTFNKIAWTAKPFQYTFAGIGNNFNAASFDNKVEFYAGIKPKEFVPVTLMAMGWLM